MPNTGPVHVSYNWALDRTTHARSLLDSGAEGGKYAEFPTAIVKGSGEWAKFRMNEHSSV